MEEEKIYITKGDAVLALLEKGQHSKRYKLGESWELNFFEIQEAIDAMPATDVQPAKHGHWIPCSERLPEDNTTVLYVWRSENGNASVLHGWHSSIRGLGRAWHQSGVGMQRPDDEVTHWMPLPEPPKE